MRTRFATLTLAVTAILTLATTVNASDLTIPNTFVSGTKALAEDVNANFTATQKAVNSKQDKLTGACGARSFVKQVNADGSLACETPATVGTGLIGDGSVGSPIAADFAGTGNAATVARSNHSHLASDLVGGPWVSCGTLADFGSGCANPAFPITEYQYAIAYNGDEPKPIQCTNWNVGRRVYNVLPYFVQSDDPSVSMNWGGFMWYTGTNATDDDTCPAAGQWRHQYWALGANNVVSPLGGNGCSLPPVFCRKR